MKNRQKYIFVLCAFVVLCVSLVAWTLLHAVHPPRQGANNLRQYPLIAHALGGIDGRVYTNCREAFEANYALGIRVFEIDLTLTTDNHLVARHDENMWASLGQTVPPQLVDTPSAPPSLAEVLDQKILGKYTAMQLTDIVSLMAQYPDTLWVTDTKYTDSEHILQQFTLLCDAVRAVDPSMLDRIVPQIYNQPMLSVIDQVHSFPDIIYTLYMSGDTPAQILDFAEKTPRVQAITFPQGWLPEYSHFVKSLHKIGVASYTHTVNDLTEWQKCRDAGVTGIYTDFIAPEQILEK